LACTYYTLGPVPYPAVAKGAGITVSQKYYRHRKNVGLHISPFGLLISIFRRKQMRRGFVSKFVYHSRWLERFVWSKSMFIAPQAPRRGLRAVGRRLAICPQIANNFRRSLLAIKRKMQCPKATPIAAGNTEAKGSAAPQFNL